MIALLTDEKADEKVTTAKNMHKYRKAVIHMNVCL